MSTLQLPRSLCEVLRTVKSISVQVFADWIHDKIQYHYFFVRYVRPDIISLFRIHFYYTFLLYISAAKHMPPGGWRNIKHNRFGKYFVESQRFQKYHFECVSKSVANTYLGARHTTVGHLTGSNLDIQWRLYQMETFSDDAPFLLFFLPLSRIVLYFEVFQCHYVMCILLSSGQIIYMQNCLVWFISRSMRKMFTFLSTNKGGKWLGNLWGIHFFQNLY